MNFTFPAKDSDPGKKGHGEWVKSVSVCVCVDMSWPGGSALDAAVR